MPQLVACHGCGQHFMAADHILGSVVACPNCGSALSIPAPQPLAPQPLASPAPSRTLPQANLSRAATADQTQRWLLLGVVGVICLLWLLIALPNVLFWAMGRPAATVERVGAGAVIFWVGVLAACGGIFEWSFFMNTTKMRVTREWFGDQGAKWLYTAIGGVMALLGLGVTVSATAYSLFGTTVNTTERPEFAARQELTQPLAGPQVSSQPPAHSAAPDRAAPAQSENAAPTSPATAPPVAAKAPDSPPHDAHIDFSELPGQWRYLEGGYCVKVPSAIVIDRDGLSRDQGGVRHDFGGSTKYADPNGVSFAVHVAINPRNQPMDSKSLFDFKRRQPAPGESGVELILVNGLPVVKSITQNTQPGPLNKRVYTLHGTNYHFAEKQCTVTLTVRSQLPLDHADQQALRAYLNTFQRMPDQSAGLVVVGSPTDSWQRLEGGFRMSTNPLLEIRTNQITRMGRDHDETRHHLSGQTADGVEFKVDVNCVPTLNHTNEARKIAADHSRRPRPDYEHVAVEINGLLMERIARLPRGGAGTTAVEYKHLEGQHEIVMLASSKLPLDHASFQAVIRFLESLERTPGS